MSTRALEHSLLIAYPFSILYLERVSGRPWNGGGLHMLMGEVVVVGGGGLRLPELLLPHHFHAMGTSLNVKVQCTDGVVVEEEGGVGSMPGGLPLGRHRRPPANCQPASRHQ